MPARSAPIAAIEVATPEVSGRMANSAFSLAEKMPSMPTVGPSKPAARMPMRQPGSLLRFVFSNNRIPRCIAAIGHGLFFPYVVSLQRKYGGCTFSCQGFPNNFLEAFEDRGPKTTLAGSVWGFQRRNRRLCARVSRRGVASGGSQPKHRPSSRVCRVRETFLNAKALSILLWSGGAQQNSVPSLGGTSRSELLMRRGLQRFDSYADRYQGEHR